ncbi:unnamed protein product, partial [Allacma fusca]
MPPPAKPGTEEWKVININTTPATVHKKAELR